MEPSITRRTDYGLPRAARSMAEGGRRPTIRVYLHHRMFLAQWPLACAVVCRAQRGRWRPQADDTGVWVLLLTLGFALRPYARFGWCAGAVQGGAVVLDVGCWCGVRADGRRWGVGGSVAAWLSLVPIVAAVLKHWPWA